MVGEVDPCLKEDPWREGLGGGQLRYDRLVQAGGEYGSGYIRHRCGGWVQAGGESAHCSRRAAAQNLICVDSEMPGSDFHGVKGWCGGRDRVGFIFA